MVVNHFMVAIYILQSYGRVKGFKRIKNIVSKLEASNKVCLNMLVNITTHLSTYIQCGDPHACMHGGIIGGKICA